MPSQGGSAEQPSLFGRGGRITVASTATRTRQAGIRALRHGWLPRHTVTLVGLSPLLFLAYNAALGIGLGDPIWIALTGAMSLTAALILTTYLPLRDGGRPQGSSCAVMAGLVVPGAGILLHQGTGPLSGVLALAVLGIGLWQRISGTSACT